MTDYPGGWFGESWDAPVNDESPHRDTPVGVPCSECKKPIAAEDRGMLIPYMTGGLFAYHLACFLRNVGVPEQLRP